MKTKRIIIYNNIVIIFFMFLLNNVSFNNFLLKIKQNMIINILSKIIKKLYKNKILTFLLFYFVICIYDFIINI